MTPEQAQNLYERMGINIPDDMFTADATGTLTWRQRQLTFYDNQQRPRFTGYVDLRRNTDDITLKIASWELDWDNVKGPWLKNAFSVWWEQNQYVNLTCDIPTHKVSTQEGIILTLTITLDPNDANGIASFCNWFTSFQGFVSGLPQQWDTTGEQWNSDNSAAVQDYINRRSFNVPANRDNPATTGDNAMTKTITQLLESRNLIFFGAPGTGKSHELNKRVGKAFENRYERVTFYPTYSYAQFVGCYKPTMKPKDEGKGEEIAYEVVPGPFLRILVKSLNDSDHNYCLVIEEINRANAAAVFGDVFQLLDRNDKGESEYDITASEDIKKFLKEKGIDTDKLRIPSNMYIWATMNSADQGVFPMDTAFKRRWEFEYISIDNGEADCKNWTIGEGDQKYYWNKVRKFLNERLSANGVNEDKLMGPFFVKPENGTVVSDNQFKSKVLMYLWEDAARMCRRKFFDEKIKTYSDLIKGWPNVFRDVQHWDETKANWLQE